jgi:hypothetical protein
MVNTLATAAVLYGIALLEGVRQLPAGAIVLRRFALGPWHVVRRTNHETLGARLHLVSWCLPLSVPLVLMPQHEAGSGSRHPDNLGAAMEKHEAQLAWLRLVGLTTLLVLIVALPVGVDRAGMFGLAVTGALLLLLTVIQTVWVRRTLRRHGMKPRSATAASLKLLNPFSAPRAAEIVYANLALGVPPLAAAYELVEEEELVYAFRATIYDMLRTRTLQNSFCLTAHAEARVRALLERAPASAAGSAFCPRCASAFALTVARCSDCDDVALVKP